MDYGEERRLEDAAELLEVVWEKRKQDLVDEHLDTLVTMTDLAWTYGEQGRLPVDEAKGLYMKLLLTRKQMLEEEHPYTLKTLRNIA